MSKVALISALAIIALACSASGEHDLTVGSRLPGDNVLALEYVVKDGKWLRVVEVVKNYNFPRFHEITQIVCKDQDKVNINMKI